jgi:hypothetical protein
MDGNKPLSKIFLDEKNRISFFFLFVMAAFLYAQYGDAGLFHRHLIAHDDNLYISPLANLSLVSYFRDWLPDRSHFAFPLADASFAMDFRLEALTGLKTFWLTNLLLFLAGIFYIERISRLYLAPAALLRLAALALIIFHPAFTEALQWAFQRKTLLVFALLAAGSWVVLRPVEEKRPLSKRDWTVVWSCYILSLLAFPSGVLWIFWALWTGRKGVEKKQERVFFGSAFVFAGIYLAWLLFKGTGWGVSPSRLQPGFALAGIGHAVVDFFFPFWLAPYYSPVSPLVQAGIALAVLLLGLFWRFRANIASLSPLISLAAVLFFPHFFNVLVYDDFVWATHYLALPLPYLLIAAAILFSRAGKERQKLGTMLAPFFAVAFLFSTKIYAPQWTNDRALMQTCALTEGSANCLILSVEKSFNDGGCAKANNWVELALQKFPEQKENSHFRDSLPFYAYFCTSTNSALTAEQKRTALKRLPPELRTKAFGTFADILMDLQAGNAQSAWGTARASFLAPEAKNMELSPGIVNLFHGQTVALCKILQNQECDSALRNFEQARASVPTIPWIMEAGVNATFAAGTVRNMSPERSPAESN